MEHPPRSTSLMVNNTIAQLRTFTLQQTLKPWYLGSYAGYTVSSSTHTKMNWAELATLSGCMHAYQTRRADFGKQAQLLHA